MSRKRVLVIDDEPLIVRSVRMVLLSVGFDVETANSGPEALGHVDNTSFDLIITDWKMPFMRGDRLAGEIRKRNPFLPVLLLTGSIFEAPPSGFNAVLFKPFSLEELREAVKALVADSSPCEAVS